MLHELGLTSFLDTCVTSVGASIAFRHQRRQSDACLPRLVDSVWKQFVAKVVVLETGETIPTV